jgi:NADPH2:quinone reductase
MSGAIILSETGGPEKLVWQESPARAGLKVGGEESRPKTNEVRIRHTAIGLNYIDTYVRTGLYPAPLPCSPGLEAAGVVIEVGEGVSAFTEGDRVAYPAGPIGAYCEERNIPADNIVKIPDGVSDEEAAALLLKGCTVEFMIRRLFPVNNTHTVLFHAAAGGVGLLAMQWLSHIGATVIGTISSSEKAALAKANGCTHTINYREENFQKRVMEITDGEGVDVVFDSAGKDTFMGSLDSLKPCGMMVTYGNTTGPVDPVPPALLAQKGSLILTRPTLMHYVNTREKLVASTTDVFNQIKAGVLKANINQRFALKDAAQAHRALEAGATKGQSLLIP